MNFWDKNKVLIIGLLMAIATALAPIIDNKALSWQVIAVSVGIAITAYLSKNLRGQWITILGSFGAALTAILPALTSGSPIGWGSTILALMIQILGAVSPAGKSLAYEAAPEIVKAKQEAKAIDKAQTPPITPPVATEPPIK